MSTLTTYFPLTIVSFRFLDNDEYGYNMFDEVPNDENDAKADKSITSIKPSEPSPTTPITVDTAKEIKTNKCDSNSNIMLMKTTTRKRPPTAISSPENHRNIKSKYKNLSPCTVVLTNMSDKNNTKANGVSKPATPTLSATNQIPDIPSEQPEIIEFSDDDSDADFFEIEESQAPHVPLYHLRDEGQVKWALLSDLCYMLKVKSKDTLLKQVRFVVVDFDLKLRLTNATFFPLFNRSVHRCPHPVAAIKNCCANLKWETFWNEQRAFNCYALAKSLTFVRRKSFW